MGMFGRTDSEIAFQEFLKRIPSASNLAATFAGSAGGGLEALAPNTSAFPSLGAHPPFPPPAQLQQQPVQHQQEGTGSHNNHHHHSHSASAASGGGHHNGGAGGVPRVSSLDLLARLVSPGAYHHHANGLGGTPPAGATAGAAGALFMDPGKDAAGNNTNKDLTSSAHPAALGPLGLPGLGAPDAYTAALSAAALHPAAASHPLAAAAAAAALTHPAAAAAAALQLQGQLHAVSRQYAAAAMHHAHQAAAQQQAQQAQHGHGSGVGGTGVATSAVHNPQSTTSHSDGETHDKGDQRRARRMLSNRESARRSRRRKQEHLSRLETELNDALDDKKQLADKCQTLDRRCMSAEEENKRLKDENERLRDELRFLRNEFSSERAKERNGWRRPDPHPQQDDCGLLGGFSPMDPSALAGANGGMPPSNKRGRTAGGGAGAANGRQATSHYNQQQQQQHGLMDEGDDDSGQFTMSGTARHYLPLA